MVMLRCALLVLVLGVASAADPQALLDQHDASIEGDANQLLRGSVSAEAAVKIQNVLNSLGNTSTTKPTQHTNVDLPKQGPPVHVPATQPAPWHAIARPANATCAVAVKPYLLFENAYEAIPGYLAKDPTASQVPTQIRGALSLVFFNADQTAIEAPFDIKITGPSYLALLDVANAKVLGNVTNGTLDLAVTQAYQKLQPYFGNMVNVTLTLATSSQDLAPTNISINGKPCSIQLNITLSNVVPNDKSPIRAEPLSREEDTGFATVEQFQLANSTTVPLSVSNGQLFGTDSQPVTLKGVNWFGFETSNTLVDGLWQGPTALTQDFGTVAYRIQLLGFNAIRLPFSFQVLLNTAPISFTASCTPVTTTQIGQSVIPPGTILPPNATPPQQRAPTGGTTGVCNADMPNNSVYARFLYVIKVLVDNGFYVLIDNHLNLDSTAVDNPTRWVMNWANLMASIVAMGPQYQNSVMADILNEPDSRGLTWTSMSTYYLNAMDAIYKVSPTTLFFVEGGGQLGFSMCWGDGFVTDPGVIARYGLTDPKPFFDTVLTRPYANQVVISPHYYPPSISGQTMNYTGVGLFYKMQASFGSLTAGYGPSKHVFPVVFGETGSFYTSATDVAMLADMARYMRNDYSSLPAGYSAVSFPHANMPSLFWWDWNANSGDTGGLVDNDWLTILWSKINWLTGAINLTPWYLTYEATSPTTLAPTPMTASPTPMTPAPTLATPTPISTTLAPVPVTAAPLPTTTRGPDTMESPPITVGAPPTSIVSSDTATCTITYTLTSGWATQSSAPYANTLNMQLTNIGTRPLTVPYTLAIYSPSYALIAGQAWNWGASGSATNGTFSGPISMAWQNVASGASLQGLGANIWATTTNLAPVAASVNGLACQLKSA